MTEACPMHPRIEQQTSEVAKELIVLNRNLALQNTILTDLKEQMLKHIYEAEMPGGHREQIITLKTEHEQVKRDIIDNRDRCRAVRAMVWKVALVGGIVGGVVGKFAAEFIDAVIRLIVK